MVTISYAHQFNYNYDPQTGKQFPALPFRIANLQRPELTLDTIAYLDSGAEYSLFQGWLIGKLGLDLMSGPLLRVASATGSLTEARLHKVRLFNPDLGDFALEIGFSTAPMSRNLLGRNFFNLIQIGFRERHLSFYVTPAP